MKKIMYYFKLILLLIFINVSIDVIFNISGIDQKYLLYVTLPVSVYVVHKITRSRTNKR